MSLAILDARVVVALDFGTTFSGFAYAHKTAPNDVYKFYEWPDSAKGGGRPYCKTQTGLYYVPQDGDSEEYDLKDWGWTAQVSYTDAVQQAARAHRRQELRRKNNLPADGEIPGQVGVYITKFKLHLAGEENVGRSVVGALTAERLPLGLTTERCISDYLAKISAFIFEQLQKKFGDQLARRDVQWCLTVPAIWDDSAKQKMKACAERAGMVSGSFAPKDAVTSPHPLLIILEPEAASFYCMSKSRQLDLEIGDQFLIADIGGGTTDIVVHAKASDGPELKVREVQASSGGLCGGTNVDMNFVKFLRREIGCLEDFVKENASLLHNLLGRWQTIKSTFDGKAEVVHNLDLPARLVRAWEQYDESEGVEARSSGYDELYLTKADMKSIFDPVVDEIIHLIEAKMTEEVKVLMVVGGFSASPYLMARITEAFRHRVEQIINPPEPGCAICHGALLMGIASSSGVISRISRKTYGIRIARTFNSMVDPPDLRQVYDGLAHCTDVFEPFVCKGSEVEVDQRVSEVYYPALYGQKAMGIRVFSCSGDTVPGYVRDEGVVCEGSFTMDIFDGMELEKGRAVSVSMFFGRSAIEVQAQRINFGDTTAVEKLPMRVEFNHS